MNRQQINNKPKIIYIRIVIKFFQQSLKRKEESGLAQRVVGTASTGEIL
jgi:hypothetical protein